MAEYEFELSMDLREYVDMYDKIMTNLIIAKDQIEFWDEIYDFCKFGDALENDLIYDNQLKCEYTRKTLIKFINLHKSEINLQTNIFLNRTGSEIWYEIMKLYEEVFNEED